MKESRLEDNDAYISRDCHWASAAPILSLGFNVITTTDGCNFTPAVEDRVDNLLLNASFEVGRSPAFTAPAFKRPLHWDILNFQTSERLCEDLNIDEEITTFGTCSMFLAAGETLRQSIDGAGLTLATDDVLEVSVSVAGNRPKATNGRMILKVTYNDPLLNKSKVKDKLDFFTVSFGGFGLADLTLLDGDVKSIIVSFTNKNAAKKLQLDHTFLTVNVIPSVFRSPVSGPLPLPAIPDGFRGEN
jgi:hypothetical protein